MCYCTYVCIDSTRAYSMCVNVHFHACMYTYACICMYVFMHAYIRSSTYTCIFVCNMYAWIYVCMNISLPRVRVPLVLCGYVCMCIYVEHLYAYVWKYACTYGRNYVCMAKRYSPCGSRSVIADVSDYM